MPRAASAAGDRAQPTPEPPARPVRPAADAMVNYVPKPKAPPCPVVVAAAFQAAVNVNQRHSSQAMEVDKDDRVPMKVPPIHFQQGPTSFYAPIPPPIKEPPMPKPKAPPCPEMKLSFLDAMSDGRDLHRNKRASAQVATMGKAAGTSLITGVAAKAAEQLGANAQQMDSFEP